MKAAEFAYEVPKSIQDAFALKQSNGEHAQFLAGGQSLIPAMNMRLNMTEGLIDLGRIPALKEIQLQDRQLQIGAMVTHEQIANSALVKEYAPLLIQASRYLAHTAIRNRGTFGGSIALADPAAEWPAACLLLEAQINILTQSGFQRVVAKDFFQGLYTTSLGSNDLLESILIPVQAKEEKSVVIELARRQGDYALAGIMARGSIVSGKLHNLGLVFFGISDRPIRLVTLEAQIMSVFSGEFNEALQKIIQSSLDQIDIRGDLYTTEKAKRHLCAVLVKRVLAQFI